MPGSICRMAKRKPDTHLIEAILSDLDHGGTPDKPFVRISRQLDPETYRKVDEVIRYAGGVWNRPAEAHVFPPGSDTKAAIASALEVNAHHDSNALDFFPTPDDVADRVVDAALDDYLRWRIENSPQRIRVLEPSAGTGSLLRALFRIAPRERFEIVAFEIDPRHFGALATLGIEPIAQDFLTAPIGAPVHIVLANPPFKITGHKDGWVLHLLRAIDWMAPEASLAAIVPAAVDTVGTRTNARLVDLVAMVHAGGYIERLPDNAFATRNKRLHSTSVATRLIRFEKPGRSGGAYEGWSNYHTWATALIICNNSAAMLEEATKVLDVDTIEKKLIEQRPRWIQESAPWVTDLVNVREIARHLYDCHTECTESPAELAPTSEIVPITPATSKPSRRPKVDSAELPLFAFANTNSQPSAA